MASATGIPDQHTSRGEEEPLLGRPGDASQPDDKPIAFNLAIGTAAIAQAGIWILTAIVWAAIFNSSLMLFSAHPLLNTAALLLTTQAILILQPTHTPSQKRTGAIIHFSLNLLATLSFAAGLIIIYYNKALHNGAHFVSAHARFGLVTYIWLGLQALVGFTMYYLPGLYGGEENAKSVWKYHRMSGYVVVLLGLATVCAATFTGFNATLKIQLWAVVVASVLVVIGMGSRIKLQKFGLRK